jgi:hypothetical protein
MQKNIFMLMILLVFSCKTKQLIEPPKVIVYEDFQEEVIENQRWISGKILGEHKQPLSLVAIKFVLNEQQCLNAYSDLDGLFSINFNDDAVDTNSYFELVFKGYSRKIVPFSTMKVAQMNRILLEKRDTLITENAYRSFYEEIRRCRL